MFTFKVQCYSVFLAYGNYMLCGHMRCRAINISNTDLLESMNERANTFTVSPMSRKVLSCQVKGFLVLRAAMWDNEKMVLCVKDIG